MNKTIYVKDDETWAEIGTEAKKRNWSISEYLIICHEELVRATEAFKNSKLITDTEMAKILKVVVVIDEKLDKIGSSMVDRKEPVQEKGVVESTGEEASSDDSAERVTKKPIRKARRAPEPKGWVNPLAGTALAPKGDKE